MVSDTNTATVATGSHVTGNGIALEAVTPASKQNEIVAWGASAGGGQGDVGIAGSVAINIVTTFDTEASAAAGSTLTSKGDITVKADTNLDVQTLAASGAFSSGASVGVAVAIAYAPINAHAHIDGTADAHGDTSPSRPRSRWQPTKIPLPLLSPSDDPSATSIAVAGAASNGDAAVGASVIVNVFDLNATAYIGDGAQINQTNPTFATQSVTVQSTTTVNIVSIAGALSISLGGAGVGAGVDVEVINTTTKAYIGAGALVTSGGAATLSATNTETILSIAAVASVADSAAVAATASIPVINSDTEAYLSDSTPGHTTSLLAGGTVGITATDTFKITIIAGSVGVGGDAGIGAAFGVLVHGATTLAYIGAGDVATAGGAGMTISATESEDILSIAAGIAIGGTAGVAGSATVGVLSETTKAFIAQNANVHLTAGSLVVDASDTTSVISVAGSVAGGEVGVGAGADVGVVGKNTFAYIDSGAAVHVDGGNITVDAESSESLISVSAGLGGGLVGVAVNAGVHSYNITTRAFIGNDPEGNETSAGPGSVIAWGSIAVMANDAGSINEIAAVLAAGGVGVGAGIGVNVETKETRAFIGAGASVEADGNGSGLTVDTGAITSQINAAPTIVSGAGADFDGSSASNVNVGAGCAAISAPRRACGPATGWSIPMARLIRTIRRPTRPSAGWSTGRNTTSAISAAASSSCTRLPRMRRPIPTR